jgi:hypothetical protein
MTEKSLLQLGLTSFISKNSFQESEGVERLLQKSFDPFSFQREKLI